MDPALITQTVPQRSCPEHRSRDSAPQRPTGAECACQCRLPIRTSSASPAAVDPSSRNTASRAGCRAVSEGMSADTLSQDMGSLPGLDTTDEIDRTNMGISKNMSVVQGPEI